MLHLSTVERTKAGAQWPVTPLQPRPTPAPQFVHHSVGILSCNGGTLFDIVGKLQKATTSRRRKGQVMVTYRNKTGKNTKKWGSRIHIFFVIFVACLLRFALLLNIFHLLGQNFLTCCSANWISPHRHCRIMANTLARFVCFFIPTWPQVEIIKFAACKSIQPPPRLYQITWQWVLIPCQFFCLL